MTDSINLWLVIFHVFETSSVLYYIFFIFLFFFGIFCYYQVECSKFILEEIVISLLRHQTSIL